MSRTLLAKTLVAIVQNDYDAHVFEFMLLFIIFLFSLKCCSSIYINYAIQVDDPIMFDRHSHS
jgi:hypothetical protein